MLKTVGAMHSIEDVMLALGRLQQGVEHLREDFREEKLSAHESRAIVHRRLDEQAAKMAEIEKDVVSAARQMEAVQKTVDTNHAAVKPSVEDWKRMKTMGVGLAGLLAIGGLSAGAALTWAGDAAVTAIRHWLRIP